MCPPRPNEPDLYLDLDKIVPIVWTGAGENIKSLAEVENLRFNKTFSFICKVSSLNLTVVWLFVVYYNNILQYYKYYL